MGGIFVYKTGIILKLLIYPFLIFFTYFQYNRRNNLWDKSHFMPILWSKLSEPKKINMFSHPLSTPQNNDMLTKYANQGGATALTSLEPQNEFSTFYKIIVLGGEGDLSHIIFPMIVLKIWRKKIKIIFFIFVKIGSISDINVRLQLPDYKKVHFDAFLAFFGGISSYFFVFQAFLLYLVYF